MIRASGNTMRQSTGKTAVLGLCIAMLALGPPSLATAQVTDQAGYSARSITGKTEVEKAMGRCAAAVIGGALLGAIAGNQSNQAGRGAAVGAAVGAGVCAMMMSVASSRDKENLRLLQLQAVNTGQPQAQEWRTSDGQAVSAVVNASNVVEISAPKTQEVVQCRRANTRLTMDGQESMTSDVVCLQGDSWVTVDQLKKLGIKSSDIEI